MTNTGIDHRRALAELGEVFWAWDPLNLASERDILPGEYDDQVKRTLDLLKAGADEATLSADLAAWIERRTPVGWPDRDRVRVDAQREGIATWWSEFQRLPPPTRPAPWWGSGWLALLLVVWLAVVGANLALNLNELPGMVADGVVALAPSFAGLLLALLPAATLLGAPRIARENPPLLAGSVLLVISIGIPGLVGRLRLIYAFDAYEDPVRFTLAQNAVAVLGVVLTLWAAWLLAGGLGRLGAAPVRWVRSAILLAVGLVLLGYLAAFFTYGRLWVESVSANVPGLLWASAIGTVGLFATATIFLFALDGARRGLPPRFAWLLAASGFGALLLTPVASTLSFTVGQAVPELAGSWIVGFALSLFSWLAIPAAFLAGLGGGGITPPWIPWLRDRWRSLRPRVAPAV